MYIVLFDIDGTLIQTGGAGKVAFLETFQQDFGITELPQGITFAGRSDRAIAQEIMQASGIEPTEAAWQKFYAGYTNRLPNALVNCPGKVLPGVRELIKALQIMDHALIGLITGNIEKGAEAKLLHYGLYDNFTFGGFGDIRTERNDIAADAKQAAITLLANMNGSTASKVMVIGDTLNDVTCAQSIGAYAVAVATGGNSPEELAATNPDLLLDDLTDTEALLAEVESLADCDEGLISRL